MNRLDQLFRTKRQRLLNIFCTAGFPHLDSTSEVLLSLETSGADLVEIGMPYSDPIADGPIIQESNTVALKNGVTITKILQQVREIRQQVHLPVILMGYLNPVLLYGVERFCKDANEAGVDGVILPDLPLYEFETYYKPHFEYHNIRFIFLITPQTSEERIREIDAASSSFIYAVSSSSTTGSSTTKGMEAYLQRLKEMALKNPVLVGFGIKDKESFDLACTYANGAVIGSAYIRAIQNSSNIPATTAEFISGIIS